ncbi:ABC transporter [Anaerocolumna cellulosilytica]|uniref:ABC transporter n=1 Tax=Anaerocolumna cellulosilytica TaxID=433286 RepID=A0A6S6R478_9FIRM|nr:ATP-binding cassette domain-containing protein [Anaerocolumna cellulosilytica]MBB5193929.1 ABC-2 type transport system ATP-binding protein [Anaerocolumna cellulosilytica]BCJ94857.1 ABC transporter [Anaerocolumna cellulosilytica]
MQSEISVRDLGKIYKIPVRGQGLLSSFKSLIHPVYTEVSAVNNISFDIQKEEMVGFIGPNGAGKTTTLKMLSGLLYPTSGNITVAGYKPYERKREYLKKISMIMGNKSQMNPSITVMDSFYVTKEIYQISDEDYKRRLGELVDLLSIEELLPKLSRNLSLGERAKCEFVMALLYCPDIVFLDEPTLGMDVSIQLRLRSFIKEYNKRYNTTFLLTSHYMSDITSLCSRVILINKGELMYDGDLQHLGDKLLPFKLIKVVFSDANIRFEDIKKHVKGDLTLVNQNEQTFLIRARKDDISQTSYTILSNFIVNDLTIEDPEIESLIDLVYSNGVNV